MSTALLIQTPASAALKGILPFRNENSPDEQKQAGLILRQQAVDYLREGKGLIPKRFKESLPDSKQQAAYLTAQSNPDTYGETYMLPALAELYGVNVKVEHHNHNTGENKEYMAYEAAPKGAPTITLINTISTDDFWDAPGAQILHNHSCLFHAFAVQLNRLNFKPALDWQHTLLHSFAKPSSAAATPAPVPRADVVVSYFNADTNSYENVSEAEQIARDEQLAMQLAEEEARIARPR